MEFSSPERVLTAVRNCLDGRLCVDGFAHLIRRQIDLDGARDQPWHTDGVLAGVLCLETFAAVGGAGQAADRAAAALTLLFSWFEVHDDIERETRDPGGKPALWQICGIPQAINAGDGMFPLAVRAMLAAGRNEVESLALARELTAVVVTWGEGQHFLLAGGVLDTERYYRAIEQTAGGPMGFSASVGARLGGADESCCAQMREYGVALGTAARLLRSTDPARETLARAQRYRVNARQSLLATGIEDQGLGRLEELATRIAGPRPQ
jgi:hypothetical protein